MRPYRLGTINGHNESTRLACPCANWRWHTGTLTLIAAALMVIMPSADAAMRRHRGQGHPIAAASAGFVASPSSAAVWASLRRQHRYQQALDDPGRAAGSEAHRHSYGGGWAGPSLGLIGGYQEQQQQQQLRQGVARLLRTGSERRASLQQADAVKVCANVSVSTVATQSVEGKEARVTPLGGRAHTAQSKSRISAANKGNIPWNAGGKHSEETRRKIAEGSRRAARRRREAAALSLVRREGSGFCLSFA